MSCYVRGLEVLCSHISTRGTRNVKMFLLSTLKAVFRCSKYSDNFCGLDHTESSPRSFWWIFQTIEPIRQVAKNYLYGRCYLCFMKSFNVFASDLYLVYFVPEETWVCFVVHMESVHYSKNSIHQIALHLNMPKQLRVRPRSLNQHCQLTCTPAALSPEAKGQGYRDPTHLTSPVSVLFLLVKFYVMLCLHHFQFQTSYYLKAFCKQMTRIF